MAGPESIVRRGLRGEAGQGGGVVLSRSHVLRLGEYSREPPLVGGWSTAESRASQQPIDLGD